MQAAVEDKRLYRNPCKGNSSIKPPKKPERKARAWEQDRVDAVREALAARYRITVDLGVGCGLRQGEVFGFSPDDVHDGFVHVERQILMYKSQLYFGPPKGGKERDAPLPQAIAKRILTHQEHFEPIEVTLPWLDPEEPDLAREDRRKVTVRLLVYTVRRGPINPHDLEHQGMETRARRSGSHPAAARAAAGREAVAGMGAESRARLPCFASHVRLGDARSR